MSAYRDASPGVRYTTLEALRAQGLTWQQVSGIVGASEASVHRDWRNGRAELAPPRSRRVRELLSRVQGSPCHESPLPGFLDPPELDPHSTYYAWLMCHGCPVKDACLELTDPKPSGFEGVCAARVWVNGHDVTEPFVAAYVKSRARRRAAEQGLDVAS